MLNVVHQDGTKYSATRDVVYRFPVLAREAAARLVPDRMGRALTSFVDHHGVTHEELVAASAALGRFVAAATRGPDPDFRAALAYAGLDAVRPPAWIALLASVGRCALEDFHHLARETLGRNEAPAGSEAHLEALARQAEPLSVPVSPGGEGA